MRPIESVCRCPKACLAASGSAPLDLRALCVQPRSAAELQRRLDRAWSALELRKRSRLSAMVFWTY